MYATPCSFQKHVCYMKLLKTVTMNNVANFLRIQHSKFINKNFIVKVVK